MKTNTPKTNKEVEAMRKKIKAGVYSIIGSLSMDLHDHYFREDMSVDVNACKRKAAEDIMALLNPVEKKTPDEWLKTDEFKHIKILDPDGWDRSAKDWNKEWNTPLTKEEMWNKTMMSTIMREAPSPNEAPKGEAKIGCPKCGIELCGCEADEKGVLHYGCAHIPDAHQPPAPDKEWNYHEIEKILNDFKNKKYGYSVAIENIQNLFKDKDKLTSPDKEWELNSLLLDLVGIANRTKAGQVTHKIEEIKALIKAKDQEADRRVAEAIGKLAKVVPIVPTSLRVAEWNDFVKKLLSK